MRHYRIVKVDQQILVSKTCDVCGKTYNQDKTPFEFQGMQSVHFICGYDSVFGDMAKMDIDICQHCLKEKLGKWVGRRI